MIEEKDKAQINERKHHCRSVIHSFKAGVFVYRDVILFVINPRGLRILQLLQLLDSRCRKEFIMTIVLPIIIQVFPHPYILRKWNRRSS